MLLKQRCFITLATAQQGKSALDLKDSTTQILFYGPKPSINISAMGLQITGLNTRQAKKQLTILKS